MGILLAAYYLCVHVQPLDPRIVRLALRNTVDGRSDYAEGAHTIIRRTVLGYGRGLLS
jgi:hypothetical protein